MCIERLHGSEATCWTTRRTDVPPTDATNCAAPALPADEVRIHARPWLLAMLRETPEPLTDKLKFTGTGCRTRLRNLSKTKAMPLMASGRATGTRDGRARKLNPSGCAGVTRKGCDCELLPDRNRATQPRA